MGAVLSGVRHLSNYRAMDNYNRDRVPKENRPMASLIARDISPNASSYERSRKFRRSIDTSKEDRSSYQESGDSDESESIDTFERNIPDSHSSDTSYDARSLPEVQEYSNWCRDYEVDDENWIRAVRSFNRSQKTWKRIATPARSLRRIGSAPTGLKWTKCVREVYKREPASEWVVVPDPKQELTLRKYKRVEEEIDQNVDRLARLTLDVPSRSSSFSSSSCDDDDDVSTGPERSKITTSSDDEDMTSSSDY